jgi:thiosulfate dehydrogenase [quinone] large subunit
MFCFAGLQKLANPRFFDAADPASIQSQLAGAAWRSPVHALISPLAHIAVPLGFLIAFGELAVGMGTLLGPAAAGGLALSLMLFLTVSFIPRRTTPGRTSCSRSPGRRCCWPVPAR